MSAVAATGTGLFADSVDIYRQRGFWPRPITRGSLRNSRCLARRSEITAALRDLERQ